MPMPTGDVEKADGDPLAPGQQLQSVGEDGNLGDGRQPFDGARGKRMPYPSTPPFPDPRLRMVDRIDLYLPEGGRHGLGLILGSKDVTPEEWKSAQWQRAHGTAAGGAE